MQDDTLDLDHLIAELETQFKPELVLQLLETTHVELVEKGRQLAAALDPPALDNLRRYAHSLKTTAGAIGIQSLAERALRTEQATDEHLAAIARELLDGVKNAAVAIDARIHP